MSDNRLLGQDTIFRFIEDGSVVAELTDIQEFSMEYDRTMTEEGYAGEKANRYGEVFNGLKGDVSAHISDPKLLVFIERLNLRAQRKVSGMKVDAISVFPFPDGQDKKVIISDLSFGSISTRNSGRGAYHSFSTSWGASSGKTL